MPIVVNSNASATEASFNLSRANDALRKSLARLSSGKRINSPAEDAGGLAVAYKLNSTINRTYAVIQNSQNALSYLQVQDAGLKTVGNILDRMSELRVMSQDVTKNSGDIENYSKEFIELQGQLNQITRETFNGISLFARETAYRTSAAGAATDGVIKGMSDAYISVSNNFLSDGSQRYDKFGRQLITSASGVNTDGSVALNVVNLQYVLSIGTTAIQGMGNVDLGGIHNIADDDLGTPGNAVAKTLGHVAEVGETGAGLRTGNAHSFTSNNFISRIQDVNVSQFTEAIERLADMRAENGAEQNRVMTAINLLQTNVTNLEAAHGRIMDADIALESTRFARENVLVQASASMAAQANQLTNVALLLLG